MSGRYVVRTYGCQMNEHDSERIAGLLAADGYEEASGEDDADIIVLNTCCIRENADNKLYGNLGHLKTWKDEKDGRQIVVAGCLSQKDRDGVRGRAPYVDVVLGTHNVHRTAELISHAREHGRLPKSLKQRLSMSTSCFRLRCPSGAKFPTPHGSQFRLVAITTVHFASFRRFAVRNLPAL